MKKIWQKSLASMVSAALCLTAFVGCLTVNAAAKYNGTIASEGATVEATATEAIVDLLVSADVPNGVKGMAYIGLKANTTFGALAGVVVTEGDAAVDLISEDGESGEAIGTDGQFIIKAFDTNKGVTSFKVRLTFKNDVGTLTAGNKYPVEVKYLGTSDIGAGNWDEDAFTFDVSGVNGIAVKAPAHDHTWGAGVMTTMPTTTSDGVITYTCKCGKTKTEAFVVSGTITTNTSKTSEDVDKVKVQYGAKFNSAVFADIQANGGTVTAIGMLFTKNGSALDFSNQATKPVYEYTGTIPSGASPTIYYYYQGMPFTQMSDSLTFRPYVKYTNSEGTVSYEYGDTVSFVYIDLLASLASDNAYAIELLNYYNEYVVK